MSNITVHHVPQTKLTPRERLIINAQRAALAGNKKQAERWLALAGGRENEPSSNLLSVAFWYVILCIIFFWLPLFYVIGRLLHWW